MVNPIQISRRHARLKMGAELGIEIKQIKMSAEPSPRWGHLSVAVGHRLYVWGGQDGNKALASALQYSFHRESESWEHCQSGGSLPPTLYYGACASIVEDLYFYGGTDSSDSQGRLYKLNTKSRKWQELSSAGPKKKTRCKMIAYGKKLVVFGGYGIPSGAQYIDRRWTNELHMFDLEKGVCA